MLVDENPDVVVVAGATTRFTWENLTGHFGCCWTGRLRGHCIET
jgi:hypothetical protein